MGERICRSGVASAVKTVIATLVVTDGNEEFRAGNGNLRFGSLNGGFGCKSAGRDFAAIDRVGGTRSEGTAQTQAAEKMRVFIEPAKALSIWKREERSGADGVIQQCSCCGRLKILRAAL